MHLPPYDSFPDIPGDKISLRQVLMSDMNDLVDISFYDAKQATTVEQAIEMQEKINKDYRDGNSIHWALSIMPQTK